eukprot:CAMPEP_0117442464 /NCGR_PEP_ID=MMETSP0759-20121206/4165_1 /TAXON_ID=63605 /ORGANISM="Percolomonas cosmopolitus, Strain WS" /LENGTH=75 /DNA_ID=CAMNT_0005234353 /DNA_START=621 /DNA_END=848 /DNA_ORIENTATION=-
MFHDFLGHWVIDTTTLYEELTHCEIGEVFSFVGEWSEIGEDLCRLFDFVGHGGGMFVMMQSKTVVMMKMPPQENN